MSLTNPKRHIVIPDCQVRPGTRIDHLSWAGNYIADKRPDSIICLGDFWDLFSLNMYEKGKRTMEGARFRKDVDHGNEAMGLLTKPYRKIKGYDPNEEFLMGNHEDRADRVGNMNPELEGIVSSKALDLSGWKVHKFLEVATVDRVQYSHYFTSGVKGNPVSSAAALLRTRHSSAIMGHVQTLDIAVHPKTQHIGLFAGIFYQHNERYLGPQGNNTKRGIWVLNEVVNGTFDPMFVSLGFLKRRYS